MSKQRKKTEREYERARADRIIAERFKATCMSNAKWVRLLDALTAEEGLVVECRAKLVWDDDIREMQIDGMQKDFDYWPRAMEGMISGAPHGWYEYKEVEWIEFPEGEQDIEQIQTTIQSVGQFEVEKASAGFKLFCYR